MFDGKDAVLAQQDLASESFLRPGECYWVMHPVTWASLLLMTDYMSTGYRNNLLIAQGSGAEGTPPKLHGYPVLQSENVMINNSVTGYYDKQTVALGLAA